MRIPLGAVIGSGGAVNAPAPSRTVQVPTGRIQLVDVRRRALLLAQLRMLLVGAVFLALAAAALLRIAWIGVIEPAPHQRSMAAALLPPRGEITDRNGVPLARAFPAYALWFNPAAMDDGGPPLVQSAEAVAARLKAIFPDLDEYAVARQLASGKAGYLRRRVLPEDANRVMALGELALELPRETDRHYPQGSMAAHVLGYVEDGTGPGRHGSGARRAAERSGAARRAGGAVDRRPRAGRARGRAAPRHALGQRGRRGGHRARRRYRRSHGARLAARVRPQPGRRRRARATSSTGSPTRSTSSARPSSR